MLLGASRGECAGDGWGEYTTFTHPTHHQSGLCLQLITPHKDTIPLTSYSFFPLLLQCRTAYAVVHGLVLLMMGIMMPETCWDRSLIVNIRLVVSCWFLSLHPTFMMHGHKSLKFVGNKFGNPAFSVMEMKPVAVFSWCHQISSFSFKKIKPYPAVNLGSYGRCECTVM